MEFNFDVYLIMFYTAWILYYSNCRNICWHNTKATQPETKTIKKVALTIITNIVDKFSEKLHNKSDNEE